MGIVTRLGFGYKKEIIRLGKIEYPLIEEFEVGESKIQLKKTDNKKADDDLIVNEWRFFYYDKDQNLNGYLVGQPIKDKKNKEDMNFYLQRIQSSRTKEKIRGAILLEQLLKKGYRALKKHFKSPQEKKNNSNGLQNERGIYRLFEFSKSYLKDEGFSRIIAQGNIWIFDTLSLSLKAGFRDLDRERKIEQYKTPEERKKYYSQLEKITGLVVLEYPL
ncbi:MAG: hypothetical protein KKB62_02910 [Nanoarchaeota archaeon]|nr:hypothetical protein [Nanoarchaeota archaeon]